MVAEGGRRSPSGFVHACEGFVVGVACDAFDGTGVALHVPARRGSRLEQSESRQLYDRLRRECPDSREAREFAVYYDLKPPPQPSGDNAFGDDGRRQPRR